MESDIELPIDEDGDVSLDFLQTHSGPGKLFPYGPVGNNNGVEVPCIIRATPHGGVTAAILFDILKELDQRGAVPRPDDQPRFLLMDGHQSRLELLFLQYTVLPRPGVNPYGTDPVSHAGVGINSRSI